MSITLSAVASNYGCSLRATPPSRRLVAVRRRAVFGGRRKTAGRGLLCALPHGDGRASSRESRHRILEFVSDQLEASLLFRPVEIRVRAQVNVKYDTFVCRVNGISAEVCNGPLHGRLVLVGGAIRAAVGSKLRYVLAAEYQPIAAIGFENQHPLRSGTIGLGFDPTLLGDVGDSNPGPDEILPRLREREIGQESDYYA